MSSVGEIKGRLMEVNQGIEQGQGGIQMAIQEYEGKIAVLQSVTEGSAQQEAQEAIGKLMRAIEMLREIQGLGGSAIQDIENLAARL